eukprot:6214193-Pleurochrysis_carterae.AAC.3
MGRSRRGISQSPQDVRTSLQRERVQFIFKRSLSFISVMRHRIHTVYSSIFMGCPTMDIQGSSVCLLSSAYIGAFVPPPACLIVICVITDSVVHGYDDIPLAPPAPFPHLEPLFTGAIFSFGA